MGAETVPALKKERAIFESTPEYLHTTKQCVRLNRPMDWRRDPSKTNAFHRWDGVEHAQKIHEKTQTWIQIALYLLYLQNSRPEDQYK